MKYSVLTLALAVGIAWTAAPVAAQAVPMARTSPPTFESADADGNGELSKEEFRNAVGDAGLYSNIDVDSDGFIDDDELNELGFDDGFGEDYTWDLDDDGFIDSGEFYDGVYSGFDADESGHWDGDEWDDAGDAGFWDV